jgi:hypothetical protein
MIALKEDFPHFTPAEYLEWEEQQDFRHEQVYEDIVFTLE